jgi:mRNA-degrading endonuclease toxin of MazEF toxin-antitoxin module
VTHDFRVGGVYSIPDKHATFPDSREERAEGKGVRNTRYVVVLQDDAAVRDPGYSRVIVAPFTMKDETELAKGANDVPFVRGEGGLTEDCFCLLGHIQPILKSDVKNFHGPLDAGRVEDIQSIVATVFGLIKDDEHYGLA